MIDAEYIGPPISDETRKAAWERIVSGLREIADSPEVLRAFGAWMFAHQLVEACEDIGAHLSEDSFQKAMEQLHAGFGRSLGLKPHELSLTHRAAAVTKWTTDRGDHRTKVSFATAFADELYRNSGYTVGVKTITDVWLKGLPR